MEMLTPMKAIRKKCLRCSGDSFNEVKNCPIKDCPLWEYRFGHRPKKDGQEQTEEDETEDETE